MDNLKLINIPSPSLSNSNVLIPTVYQIFYFKVCGGEKFPVHSYVLSSCSEVFKDLFSQSHSDIIVIDQISSEDLKTLIRFVGLLMSRCMVGRLGFLKDIPLKQISSIC